MTIEDHSRTLLNHKITTAEQIAAMVGPRPRKRKVIMCHGAFDIVHPGHVRHLLYAKSKGDILVASITADAHIMKANFRPFVPQELRAFNLAALEAVDYVIIDSESTPLNNIKLIQPDYFAKGYEYTTHGKLHPRTADEKAAVEAYGGELILTPGDIVFSSSRIIDSGPPGIATEKLMAVLQAEGLCFADLRGALAGIKGVRVHVVGDTIVDSYTQCSVNGGVTKTPAISVRFEEQNDFVGGAGVVAKHLKAAGAEVMLSTVLGDDPMAEFVRKDLAAADIRCVPVIDRTRPTTNKNVIIAATHHLLKVDKVDNRSISERVCAELEERVRGVPCDIVIFSDFRHGIFNRETIPSLTRAIPAGTFRVADSQVASRWGNILEFRGFDLITPNEREARFALGDQDSIVRPLGLELYRRAECRTLILKLGERGLMTFRSLPRHEDDVRAFFALDSMTDRVVDAVGSGDALLAYAAPSLYASGSAVLASMVGTLAAAVECEHQGNIPVRPNHVLGKIDYFERLANYQ